MVLGLVEVVWCLWLLTKVLVVIILVVVFVLLGGGSYGCSGSGCGFVRS